LKANHETDQFGDRLLVLAIRARRARQRQRQVTSMTEAALIAPRSSASGDGSAAEHAETLSEMPLPRNLQSFEITAILMLLVLVILYFTGEVVLPVIFAFLFNLLLQPAMTVLIKVHIPKTVAALFIILLFIGAVGGIGFYLSGPAAEWISKAPQSLARLEQRFSAITQPVASVQKASQEVEKIAGGPGADATSVSLKGPGLGSMVFSGTRTILAEFATMVLLLFFLLRSGDLFLRRLVEVLPTLSDKKQAVDIWHEITRNISGYLVTITMMNGAVGIATGFATYMFGLSNPILWGVLAFVLNYILILGPLSGVAILFLAGLLTFDTIWQALLPAVSYLVIHLTEGAVTPVLLARRFELNPVLVIISLVFWYWMWGIPGALLAVPLLASFKIICDRIRPLMALGHFVGGESHS
jgi:predicted PurR-regulated permease PerM